MTDSVRLRLVSPGEHGFAHHRIPALALVDDTLVAVWDGRPTGGDAPAPNSVLVRRSTDLGLTWDAARVVAPGSTDPLAGRSDPSLLVTEDGQLLCFHVFSKDRGFFDAAAGTDDEDRAVLSVELSTSRDAGQTWHHRLVTSEVVPPHTVGAFAVSGSGLRTRSGRLVQQFLGRLADGRTQAWSAWSDDHGRTWQHGWLVGETIDENKVVEVSGGRLLLNARDRAGGCRWQASSDDGGLSWQGLAPVPGLPDPSCNGDLARVGETLLLSHASDPAERRRGTLRRSLDEGRTWSDGVVFAPESCGYSAICVLPDEHVAVLFETDGCLDLARIPLARLS